MCGIAGLCGYNQANEDLQQILLKMTSVMTHRGPDDCGTFVDENAGLGFRRLSIIDLSSAGHQPLGNEDGHLQLVFNGEIYNYQELKHELLDHGHQFKSDTDTEVILHLYEELGPECVTRLRGMFAFAIWDTNKKSLFIARDWFGIKPLYYTRVGNGVAFASEVKCLLQIPGVTREVAEENLWQYFTFQYVPGETTMFKDIFHLLPAHYMYWQDGKLEIKRYWNADFMPDEPGKHPDSYYVDGIRELLRDSVRAHMMSDVPRGAFLSSGVDSSAIVAYLRKLENVKTYTVGFTGGRYNEVPDAEATARYLDTQHTSILVDEDEFLNELPKIAWHMDEPLADAAAAALYFVARRAAQDVTVVLSGEGSDEIFGGYRIYAEPAAVAGLGGMPAPIKAIAAGVGRIMPEGMRGKDYIRRATTPLSERYFGNAFIFSEAQKEHLLKHRGERSQSITRPFFDQAKRLDPVSQMQYIDMHTWLPGDILLKADKMTMAHSLELRVPFLDREVFAFASHLPPHLKVNSETTKVAMRRAVADLLPEAAASRPKLGFPVPVREWIRSKHGALLDELLAGEAAARYFNVDYVRHLFDLHRQGKLDEGRRLWTVLGFLLWHRTFIEQPVAGRVEHGREQAAVTRGTNE